MAIFGDVTRLRQILVNLLSNAVKFTETGEVVIEITARSCPDEEISELEDDPQHPEIHHQLAPSESICYELKFAVSDTGIGIPADRMYRLFRSFSQVDASTTRQFGGTGLGLAISKRLAEMMGGQMWVESRGGLAGDPPMNWEISTQPGTPGATFSFTITAQIAPPDSVSPAFNDISSLLDKRILIVDDNPTNCKILALETRSWGM